MRLPARAETMLKRMLPVGTGGRRAAREVGDQAAARFYAVAERHPALVRAIPRDLFISLTANCNLACGACHYGRSFMPGHALPLEIGRTLLADAREAGVRHVRLYGGEPLVHRDVEAYVEATVAQGMTLLLTTNGMLLRKKIDGLYAAGLRRISVGFYGVGQDYDAYVQTRGAFAILERNLAAVRERYGPDRLDIKLDWLLMGPTCTRPSVEATLAFAERFSLSIFVNLIHYSLPYFTEKGSFHFTPDDRDRIVDTVELLIERRRVDPAMFRNSERGLRSIPDWLMRGPGMRVPCLSQDLLWVGPDGTVQLCYVTFPLGNLHDTRLRDIVGTRAHHDAAKDAFALNCPNCHCGYDVRVNRHAPSRAAYGG